MGLLNWPDSQELFYHKKEQLQNHYFQDKDAFQNRPYVKYL